MWLDASLPEHAVPEDPCQLPFPPEMPALDLGPTINDALHIALPGANLCGQPDCSIQCKLHYRLHTPVWWKLLPRNNTADALSIVYDT